MLKSTALLVLVGVWLANAQPLLRSPDHDESPKPYHFEYLAPAGEDGGQHTRKETADGTGRVVGSYTVHDEDGRKRTVEYEADADGFRARIETNEPGTRNESPAGVMYTSSALDPFLAADFPGTHRRPAF